VIFAMFSLLKYDRSVSVSTNPVDLGLVYRQYPHVWNTTGEVKNTPL
jgi:hypothetical protein